MLWWRVCVDAVLCQFLTLLLPALNVIIGCHFWLLAVDNKAVGRLEMGFGPFVIWPLLFLLFVSHHHFVATSRFGHISSFTNSSSCLRDFIPSSSCCHLSCVRFLLSFLSTYICAKMSILDSFSLINRKGVGKKILVYRI